MQTEKRFDRVAHRETLSLSLSLSLCVQENRNGTNEPRKEGRLQKACRPFVRFFVTTSAYHLY